MKTRIFYAKYRSPLGWVHIAASERGVTEVSVTGDSAAFIKSIKERTGSAPVEDPARLKQAIRELELYFSGRLREFSVKTDVEGTEFERSVWGAISSIPFGETRSYSWVASKIKRPRSMRAAGNACGKNPVPIIVPCHRVLKADGSLGGYSGGDGIKERLLGLERANTP